MPAAEREKTPLERALEIGERVAARADAQPPREPPRPPRRPSAPPRQGPQRRRGSVEALLHWAFAVECAGFEHGFDRIGHRSTDTLALLERIASVGCRIDYSGDAWRIHPDAGAVAMALAGLTARDEFAWISRLSRSGMRPEVRQLPSFRPRPKRWVEGRGGRQEALSQLLGVDQHYNRRGNLVRTERRYCPLTFVSNSSEIVADRRRYRRWLEILSSLRVHLLGNGALSTWEITDEMPPEQPWRLDNASGT